jgi:hypothetical protein
MARKANLKKIMNVAGWPKPIYAYLVAMAAIAILNINNFNDPITIIAYVACFVLGYFMGWYTRRNVS